MPPVVPNRSSLSDADRQLLDRWLAEFGQSWSESRLEGMTAALPAEAPLRHVALVELIKADLRNRWQRGIAEQVESYLEIYPELGTPQTVPIELLQAEYEVRQQVGALPSWEELAHRFPTRVEELRHQVETTLKPAPASAGPPVQATSPCSVEPEMPVGRSGGPARLAEQFGRYRILRKLGAGGMGTVYLAHDTQLDRDVALKVPHFSEADGPEVLARFYREARAAAALYHGHICPVYDVGEIDGVHYLTMGYIEGHPLSDLIRDRQPLPQRQAALLVYRMAQALKEAHEHGIIHRDLKPANVLLDARGEPVIVDFGLARRLDQRSTRLTQSGAVMGTPAYMAPEQATGGAHASGPACDIYSLGVILYELLTGRLPFEGPPGMVFARLLMEEPPPPSFYRTDLDPRLDSICRKAMAKDPIHRHASAAEVTQALAAYLGIEADPVEPGASRTGRDLRDRPVSSGPAGPRPTSSPTSVARNAVRRARPSVVRILTVAAASLALAGLLVLAADQGWDLFGRRAARVGSLYRLGVAALQDRNCEQAIAFLDEVIRLDPRHAEAHLHRARAHEAAGDAEKAIEDYDQVLARQPGHAEAWNERGWVHALQDDHARALPDFDEAIRLHPGLARAYANRGFTRAFRGDLDQALADCDEAVRLAPGLAWAYANRGRVHMERKDYSRALADCTRAIQVESGSARAYRYRGMAYAAQRAYDHALADYAEALRQDPKDFRTYHSRSIAYRNLKDYDRALADCEMVIQLAPRCGLGYSSRAEVRRQQRRPRRGPG